MKVSNLGDVGQMRRSSGISINMMMKEDILHTRVSGRPTDDSFERNVQANNAKCDDEVGMEDIGDAECEAEDYAQYSGPNDVVSKTAYSLVVSEMLRVTSELISTTTSAEVCSDCSSGISGLAGRLIERCSYTIVRRYLSKCHVSDSSIASASRMLTEIPRSELFCERHSCCLVW
jgi:hypothetical protein